MNASSTSAIVIDAIQDFGTEMLTLLGAAILVGVGFFAFKVGWRKFKGIAR